MKKIILVLLALAMTCPLLFACEVPDAQDGNSTTLSSGDVTSVPDDSTTGEIGCIEIKDNLKGLNYNGDTVSVLNWNSEKPEFEIDDVTGVKVEDAIYARNAAIESRLGVSLKFTETMGDGNHGNIFLQKVEATNGTQEFDIIATYSRTACGLSIRGYYANINNVEDNYLDFENPWWPQKLVSTVMIGDALYFISGDVSTNLLHFMYTVYFNKDLKETYTDITEDFYALVRNKKWTIDKLIDLSSGRYEDNNNNEKGADMTNSDLEDTYGFCTIYYGADAFYQGSGLSLIAHDDEDMLKLHPDYTGTKAIDLVDKLQPWLTGPDCVTFLANGKYQTPFINGRALFCQERAYLASNHLTDAEFKYGILPTPLYDSKQDDYITVVGNPFTLYGISSDCDSMSEMTAVLECWGSEGYYKTTPALFYETMQARYADAPEDAEMFELIKRTTYFDIGRLFMKADLGYILADEISKQACSSSGSWAQKSVGVALTVEQTLKTIVEKYRANQKND